MSEKKSYQSWTISEEFWEAIRGDIPKTEREPKKKYVHAPGQGRKPMPARKALEKKIRQQNKISTALFVWMHKKASSKPMPRKLCGF